MVAMIDAYRTALCVLQLIIDAWFGGYPFWIKGGLFKVQGWASKSNKTSTQLFATSSPPEWKMMIFSHYPTLLLFVITGDVDF
jgi:hypothetical protein